jgi:hypothetical protein
MVWSGLLSYLTRLALVVIGQPPQAVLYGAAATALGLRPKYPREFEQFIFTRHETLPGEPPAVCTNPLLINACDFLRDVTAIATC